MLPRLAAGCRAASRYGTLRNSTSYSTSVYYKQALLKELRRNTELSQDDARDELRWITQAVENMAPMTPGEPEGAELLLKMAKQRGDGVPLQYVIGDTDFGPLKLLCRAPTLIPRPETAHCFSQLAQYIRENLEHDQRISIVDLCTGSAPIPLLLRHELGERIYQITGVDNSASALALAAENVNFTGIGNVTLWQKSVFATDFAKSLLMRLGDDGHGKQRKLSLLTANPPYIPLDEYLILPKSVRDYEDERALLSGKDDPSGLHFYKRIAQLLPEVLDYSLFGPRVAVEVGQGQAEQVRQMFERQGMARTEAWPDQWGVQRLVVGWTR